MNHIYPSMYSHLLSQIFNRAHMMTPELMALAVDLARSHLLPDVSMSPQSAMQNVNPDDDGDDGEDDDTDAGIAMISIAGPLVPRTGNLKLCQQMTAYESVAAQVNAALADPAVAHIVFDIDSPGGAATGAFELADQIRAAGQVKPTTAIVHFNAMSGAYLIASACNDISVSQSSGVGSIGVIAQHMDVSKMNEAMGVKITAVYCGDMKNNLTPNEPLTDASLQQLSDMVNRSYQQFTSAVAQFRAMPQQQVIDTQAGLYFGQDAIDAGLADRLETPQEAINRIASGISDVRAAQTQQSYRMQLQRQALHLKASAMNLRVHM
jgi:signal peptide peptidase SppA